MPVRSPWLPISDWTSARIVPVGKRGGRPCLADIDGAELVIAMDRRNIADLRQFAPAHAWGRVRLLMSFAGQVQGEVPDPYTGGRADFERSFALIREGVAGLTKQLQHLHNPI